MMPIDLATGYEAVPISAGSVFVLLILLIPTLGAKDPRGYLVDIEVEFGVSYHHMDSRIGAQIRVRIGVYWLAN